MRIESFGRQQGKTTRMLEWMREVPTTDGEVRIGVFRDQDTAMRLLRENPDLHSWQFVCFDEVRRSGPRTHTAIRGRVVLGIDDAEEVIRRAFMWPVEYAVLTTDNSPQHVNPANRAYVATERITRQDVADLDWMVEDGRLELIPVVMEVNE